MNDRPVLAGGWSNQSQWWACIDPDPQDQQTSQFNNGNKINGMNAIMSSSSSQQSMGRRQRHRRRQRCCSKAISLLVGSTLLLLLGQFQSVTCNTATTNNNNNIIERTTRPRHRWLQNNNNPNNANNNNNNDNTQSICKHGSSLHPGEYLLRGEYLCNGNLRFGIDAASGRFILGFASDISIDIGNNGTAATTNATNEFTSIGGSSNNNNANNAASTGTITSTPTISSSEQQLPPNKQAWHATPTTLFIEPTRQFAYILLSDDGNILGYDEDFMEIYDSNYDYYNRLMGKEDNSILGLMNDCRFVVDVESISSSSSSSSSNGVGNGASSSSSGNGSGVGSGGSNGSGEITCVSLMSPAMPGMPYGMATWGVMIHPEDIVDMEQVVAPPTPAPAAITSSMPTPRLRTRRPTPANTNTSSNSQQQQITSVSSPTSQPSRIPSTTTTQTNNLFEQDTTPNNNISYESTAIIWGTIWLDSNTPTNPLNGAMDQGEETIQNFPVKLYECSSDTARSNSPILVAPTDSEGMYFFQIPSGRTYRVQIDIDDAIYGYSDGVDSDTNMMGWTSCMTSSTMSPIQWNAGLYRVEEVPKVGALPGLMVDAPMSDAPPEAVETVVEQQPIKSSIGGFIYLDVDENGSMNSQERTAAVGGYTVNDAMIIVSLTDCQTKQVLAVRDVPFPGTYSFGNLTEGWYKIGYDMQVIARVGSNPNEPTAPLYSFIGGNNNNNNNNAAEEKSQYPTSYETGCGKLGKGEIIDSGNVGLRMKPLEIISKLDDGGPLFGPQTLSEEVDAMALPQELDTVRTAAAGSSENDANGGDNKSFVPGLVGALVTISIIVVAGAIFIVKRRGGGGVVGDLTATFPFLGGGSKTNMDREGVLRSVGSDSSFEGDTSMVSATPSAANQTAIGSMIVETSRSVAAMTADGGESRVECGSDEENEDEQSFTGIEFALKGSALGGVDSGSGVGGGESPYCTSPSSENSKSNNNNIEMQEEGDDGYEVYDEGEDEEHGRGNEADYGPVVSDIIAKYSQKQGGQDDEGNEEKQGDSYQAQDQSQDYSQHQVQQHGRRGYENQNYSKHHHRQGQQETHDWQKYQDHSQYDHQQHPPSQSQVQYRQGHQNQPQSGEELAIVPTNNQDSAQHNQYDAASEGGYYPNNAHDTANHQYQHNANTEYGEQFDEQTSTSGSSRSSDPPAASYRDIPASNAHAGWDGGGVHPETEEQHQHYEMAQQYAAANDSAYAGNYESTQYNNMANDGAYAAENYESNNQYTANDEGAYAGNYGVYTTTYDQHPPIASDSSDSESSEEISASGWSSSSSATNASSVSGGSSSFNWSYGSSSSAAAKSKARRAQSNPRDDRRSASWRASAIPENSTVEYHAYVTANTDDGGYNRDSGNAPMPPPAAALADDSKSVLSSGSDDPPGASYKNVHRHFPPPPPPPRRTTPPPRRTAPNNARRGKSVPRPPPRSHPSPPPRPSPPPPPR